MPFDLVPPLAASETQAVRAALAASGVTLGAAPAVYASAWRTVAAEEAAGYDADELHADFGRAVRPHLGGPESGPSPAGEGMAERP